MNKKILIASLFATLILMLPMTSVVGVSDVEEDCGCQVINDVNLARAERLFTRLEVYINIILLRFGFIPEVAEKCQEILDIFNIDKICEILFEIMSGYVEKMEEFLGTLYILLGETELAQRIIFILGEFLFLPVYPLGFLYELLGCREYP